MDKNKPVGFDVGIETRRAEIRAEHEARIAHAAKMAERQELIAYACAFLAGNEAPNIDKHVDSFVVAMWDLSFKMLAERKKRCL